MGAKSNLNLYAYAGNNPVARIDLTGFEGTSLKEMVTAGLGFAVGVAQGALPFGMVSEPAWAKAQGQLEHAGTFQEARGAGQAVGGWVAIAQSGPTVGASVGISGGSGGAATVVVAPAAVPAAAHVANGAVAIAAGQANMTAGGDKRANAAASSGPARTPKEATSTGAKSGGETRGRASSKIDRTEFRKEREAYWKSEAAKNPLRDPLVS